MSGLPDMVRRLPQVFYAAAAIVFVWQLANAFAEMSLMGGTSGLDEAAGAMTGLTKSKVLEFAVKDALYLVANGAIIHVLIAIYDKVKGQ
jgi:hypothetical protein